VAPIQSILTDVVDQLDTTGTGALDVVSDHGVVASSRTYTRAPGTGACTPSGTFGQDYGGVGASELLHSGDIAYLPQLREDAAFRTNIAVTNAGATPALVLIDLFDGAGTRLSTLVLAHPSGAYAQESRPFAYRAGRTDLDAAYARLAVISGSGLLVSASVVANAPTPCRCCGDQALGGCPVAGHGRPRPVADHLARFGE